MAPTARRYALQSAVRLSSYQLDTQAFPQATDLAHTVRFGLWSLGPSHAEADDFTEAITNIRSVSTDGYSAAIRMVMKCIGSRVRPQAGDPDEVAETIAVLGNAATIGLQTNVLEASQRPRSVPSGPDGELQEWFPGAIAL